MTTGKTIASSNLLIEKDPDIARCPWEANWEALV